MEWMLDAFPLRRLKELLLTRSPHERVFVADDRGETATALKRAGFTVVEDAPTLVVGAGGEGAVNRAKARAGNAKLWLLPDKPHKRCFDTIAFDGVLKLSYKEPDLIIFDKSCDIAGALKESSGALAASVASAVHTAQEDGVELELYAACERLIGWTSDPVGAIELFGAAVALAEAEECIDEYFDVLHEVLRLRGREKAGGFASYLALSLMKQFTKSDFDGIFIGMDRAGIRPLATKFVAFPRAIDFDRRVMFSGGRLPRRTLLTRFARALGCRNGDPGDILNILDDFSIAAEISPGTGVFGAMVERGIVEGIFNGIQN